MSPETRKTLIYGAVITAVVGGGIAAWQYYASPAATDSSVASAQQAQQDAQAQQDQTQLAELSILGSGGVSLSSVGSISNESPTQTLGEEVSAILKAAGFGALDPVAPAAPLAPTVPTPAPPVGATPKSQPAPVKSVFSTIFGLPN